MGKDLAHVRRFPAEAERVETGPVMFGDDWPGVFIRGDNARYFSVQLRYLRRELATAEDAAGVIARHVMDGLIDTLDSSNARVNDAFPAWHEKESGA